MLPSGDDFAIDIRELELELWLRSMLGSLSMAKGRWRGFKKDE